MDSSDSPKKGIITAKLHPQRVLSSLVGRSQLIRELNRFKQHPKLTILVAPAGYGKSTLMYQLMESRENYNELVCWYSLDQGDNNINTFSRYFISSYCEASLNVENQSLLDGLPNANPKERITILFEEIANENQAVTFILDDFHVLTNPKLHKFFGWMLESMPNNMSLVVGSRTKLDILQIPNLRAKSNLVELQSHKLKFSLEESRAYFSKTISSDLSEESIEQLHSKTEGWVAALQLAHLALDEHDNPDSFVEAFTGTDRNIVGYLGSCVIEQLDAKTKDFMMKTSILERMNGELCSILTNDKNAAKTIAEQERKGLFIFSLDLEKKWYRYHHLFRELLLSEFIETQPEKYFVLCQRLADWFKEHGSVNEAVGFYLKAKQYELASDLISQRAVSLVQYEGHHETLFEWLEALPEEYIVRYPKILVCYVWSLSFTRHFDKLNHIIGLFRYGQPSNKTDESEDEDYINLSLEMLDAVADVFLGNQLSARETSARWLAKWDKQSTFERATVLGALAASCIHTLEFDLARQSTLEASKAFYSIKADYGVAWMDCIYAIVCVHQGAVKEAKDVLEESLNRSNQVMGEHSYSSAMLRLSLGHVYYELNVLEKSSQMLQKGFLYIEEHGLPDTTSMGYIIRARLFSENGDFDQAYATLMSGERYGREQNIAKFESILALERGRMFIKNGNTDSARSIFNDHFRFSVESASTATTPYEKILSESFNIRLLIADRAYEEAQAILKKTIQECKLKGCIMQQLTLLILEADVLTHMGDELRALRALESAVTLAAPQNIQRVFIDEQDHLIKLLPKLTKTRSATPNLEHHDVVMDFLSRLCEQLKIDVSDVEVEEATEAQTSVAKEKLTKRELEILNLLEQGFSNQALADSLFVSLATVKWHLSNIYRKLGVHNKIQAIKAAQDL